EVPVSSFARLRLLARHETRLDRELHGREAESLFGGFAGHAFHLIEDARRLDYTHPFLGCAFAFAHTRLERLLRHRLVGKDADPDLAAALDVARHGNTARFNLTRRHPARLERLQPEITERDFLPTSGESTAASALLLSELDLFRHHHDVDSPDSKPVLLRT